MSHSCCFPFDKKSNNSKVNGTWQKEILSMGYKGKLSGDFVIGRKKQQNCSVMILFSFFLVCTWILNIWIEMKRKRNSKFLITFNLWMEWIIIIKANIFNNSAPWMIDAWGMAVLLHDRVPKQLKEHLIFTCFHRLLKNILWNTIT